MTGSGHAGSQLAGRRVLITGASRGIGSEVARSFADAGADLVITARTPEAVSKQAAELSGQYDVHVTPIAADFSSPESPDDLAERALAVHGGLDVLINNAGLSFPETVAGLDADHLDASLMVNLRAPSLLAARVGKAMAEAGNGSIISIASTAGLQPLTEHYAYSMSKAGLIMGTQVLALELGPYGVRANALCPTVTLTEMGQQVWLDQPEKAEPMLDRIPSRRFVQPAEVAAAALWLADDEESAMINGHALPLDGGLMIG